MAMIETYIAIDMGTSGSGCAYCTKDVDTINGISLWTNWGENEIKYKNPSAILYEDETPLCWGIKAVNDYRRMRKKEKKKNSKSKFYLVQNFKLNIHTREPIKVRGKVFKVEKVVSDFLKLMRIDIEEELKKQNKILERKYVKWSLTVPAIWTDSDKALMRRAARFAGILDDKYDDSDHFILALEPESAALPCLLYKNVKIEPKTRFLVFDAGGGTVDLSVYETTEGTTDYQFRIRQLKKASGGTAAGNSINKSFLDYLKNELGRDNYEEMMRMSAAQELEQNLEKFKIGYTMEEVEDDDEFFIPVPISIAKFFEKLNVDDSLFDEDEGELIISGSVLKQIYTSTITKAISYIENITKNVKNLKYIFMVGGFSSSNILYSAIRKRFETKDRQVIKPSQPGIRVLQGAIWFAKNPYIIISRCSPLTYGVNVTDKFIDGKHNKKNVVNINGKKYSQNLFKVMIKVDEIVETGTKVKIGVRAIKKDFATFEVYSTKKKKVTYVDERGCHKLINVTIPLTRQNQKFDVFMIFGETELKFEILDSETKEKLIHTAIFEFSENLQREDENNRKTMKFKKPPPIPKRKERRKFFFDNSDSAWKQKPPIPKRGKRGNVKTKTNKVNRKPPNSFQQKRPLPQNTRKKLSTTDESRGRFKAPPQKPLPQINKTRKDNIERMSHQRFGFAMPGMGGLKKKKSTENIQSNNDNKPMVKKKRMPPPRLPKMGEVKKTIIKKKRSKDEDGDDENDEINKLLRSDDFYHLQH